MVEIFVSYNHNDGSKYSTIVDEIKLRLDSLKDHCGFNYFIDTQIFTGEEWDKKIKSNLDNTKVIIYLLSTRFFLSKYIQKIEIARPENVYRYPIVLEVNNQMRRDPIFQKLNLFKYQNKIAVLSELDNSNLQNCLVVFENEITKLLCKLGVESTCCDDNSFWES